MNDGQRVPLSHPSASSENVRLRGSGAGGIWPPRASRVTTHHAIKITTITVVICMIFKASSLDSCRPRVLRHQK
jgi:hypothetical protein